MSTIAANDWTTVRGTSMSDIRVVRDYPHPPPKVWRALTVPALMALGMPEGFEAVAGNRFKYVAKPQPGWRGFVECEVLEAREPSVLRMSWVGDESGKKTFVAYLPGSACRRVRGSRSSTRGSRGGFPFSRSS